MSQFKLYKAKVTKISIPDNKGETQRKIYVSPYPPDGSGAWERIANPPNVFPTNTLGSGLITYPEVGQECIVAEWRGERQILAYTQTRGLSPYGSLIPDNLSEGGIRFGIKGINEALLKMTKEGQVTIYSHAFAQMGIDGSTSTVHTKGKSHIKSFSGGFEYNTYDKETKNTASIAMFIHKKDNPVFSDHFLRIEEVTGDKVPEPAYEYKNKAIIRSGYIADGEHPWELQTRQNIGAQSRQDKNVATLFRVGYQKEHERYGGEVYPKGTLLELSAKKNKRNDVGIFKFRYGKLNEDSPNSVDKGEIFSFYAYEGLNNNTPYGSTIIDPLGEGKGWGLSYKKKAEQVYIQSVGRHPDSNNSFERKFLKDDKEDFKYYRLLGGANAVSKRILHHDNFDYHELMNGNRGFRKYLFDQFSVEETLENKWSVQYSEGDSEDSISIEKDKITIQNDSNSKIEVYSDKISIQNDSDSKIEVNGDKITISTKGTKLEITKTSFKVNGRSLMFEEIADAFSTSPQGATVSGGPMTLIPSITTALKLPTNRT